MLCFVRSRHLSLGTVALQACVANSTDMGRGTEHLLISSLSRFLYQRSAWKVCRVHTVLLGFHGVGMPHM